MNTLEDAWRWYGDARASLRRLERIGEKWWDHVPWGQAPWKGDRRFVDLSKESVIESAVNAREHLDDVAVVVLFSVFEATVREVVLDQIAREEGAVRHRSIIDAIEKAKGRVREGSFFAVLEPFKPIAVTLIEEVNQVRRFRNWVSHGKRGRKPADVTPEIAYERLGRCLPLLVSPPNDETSTEPSP